MLYQQRKRAQNARQQQSSDFEIELEELSSSTTLRHSLADSISHKPDESIQEHYAHIQRKALKEKTRVWDKKTGDKYLGGYFMVIGTFCVVALGACVVGTLRQQADQFLVSTDPLYQRNSIVLAGYSTWPDMTTSCCCLPTAHPSESFSVGVRWVCGTKKYIERGRVTRSGADNATAIRSICAENATLSGCTIFTNGDGKPYMYCTDTAYASVVPSPVSATAFQYYF